MKKVKQNLKFLYPNSLKVRIMLAFAAVVVALLVGVVAANAVLTNSEIGDFVDDSENASANRIGGALAELYHADRANFISRLPAFNLATEITIVAVDANYQIIGVINGSNVHFPTVNLIVNYVRENGLDNLTDPSNEIIQVVPTPLRARLQSPLSLLFVGDEPEDAYLLTVSQRFSRGSVNVIDFAATGVESPDRGDLARASLITIIISSVIGGLSALALLATILNRAFKPVNALVNAAENLGRGRFSERVKEGGVNELARLSRAFNEMVSNLEKGELRRKQLTADIAHELRTPLTGLKGYLEGIQDKVIEPTPEILNSMRSQADHLNRIIDDLAFIAVADTGELTVNLAEDDMAQLARDVISEFGPSATQKSKRLIYDGPQEARWTFDAVRMRQVMTNLINNALQHTDAGGEIAVKIDASNPAELAVSVADDGPGIPPEHLEHIMERFYRVDQSRSRATGGSGLGLTIVKTLASLHGGSVKVASTVGAGATFTILLPRNQRAV